MVYPLAFDRSDARLFDMPYKWMPQTDPDVIRLRLWPHRSLPRRGFVWFIAATAALLALPLLTQLGTAGLWVLLPFLVAPLAGLWIALQHSYRTGTTAEDLTLTPDLIAAHRSNPRAPAQDWQACSASTSLSGRDNQFGRF